jgi:iron complex outermembrane recepter protein
MPGRFRHTERPETSLTYELGLRSSRMLDWGWLTGVDGQLNYYHLTSSRA